MNHKKSYRYFSSWDYCEKDFESALQQLKAERSALCRQDRILSDNNAKYVWRIPLTGDNGQEYVPLFSAYAGSGKLPSLCIHRDADAPFAGTW